jgi:mono/diheme cytochrome c family protein
MLLLVGLLEGLALSPRLRVRTDPALSIILRLAVASAIVTFALGLMLAEGGGYPEGPLRLHRRLAFGTVLGLAVSVVVWSHYVERRVSRLAHRIAVGATLSLLGAGAHFGGSMTHGEGYLVERAPSFVKAWLGYGEPPAGEAPPRAPMPTSDPRVFEDVVLPVVKQKCAGCHTADTAKGRLRLDSFEALMKGGKAGPAVEVGDARRSLLMRRIETPISDDRHMPPEGKPQLTSEEIELIALWIDGGASSTTKVRDLIVPDGARRLLIKASGRARVHGFVDPAATDASSTAIAPAALGTTAAPPSPPITPGLRDDDEFRVRVAPILATKCGHCHGANRQKGNLRTDSLAALLAGGESGPAIVPSAPGRGTLLTRVRLPADDARHMPPREAPQLDAIELRLLARWLARGAGASLPLAGRIGAPWERVTTENERAPVSGEEPATTSLRPSPAGSGRSPECSSQRLRLFVDVVQPILANRCGDCHSGERPAGGLVVLDRDALLARSHVRPGDPSASPLFSRMTSPLADDDHMPPRGAPQPSRAEIDAIRSWIECGASANVDANEGSPAVHGLAPTASAKGAGTRESSVPTSTAMKVTRSNVGGGCAGCTVTRGDAPERRALGFGSLLLTLFVLRRGASMPRDRPARSYRSRAHTQQAQRGGERRESWN